ncbi:hypothetical protein [Tunturiibacter gelidiferens]|uniref:hypothetical protein n=1 Tax=Tunturiibacter gelidiferens TaxID=3069689 RepID=UPI003D9AB81A
MTLPHRSRFGSLSVVAALSATLFCNTAASVAQSTAPNSRSTDTQSDKPQEGGQASAMGEPTPQAPTPQSSMKRKGPSPLEVS